MANLKVVLNSSGVKELLKSSEMIRVLEDQAETIARRCSGSYSISTYTGKNRANVSISTSDSKTYYKNLHDNELLKGLKG